VKHLAITVAVLATGVIWITGAAAGGAQARRVGPIVRIAHGSQWVLRGWQSTYGVCLKVSGSSPGGGWSVCGLGHREKGGNRAISASVRNLGRKSLVLAAVSPRVSRVKVTTNGRHWERVRLYRAPRALKTRLRFLRLLLPNGSPTGAHPRWRVVAVDRSGKQIAGFGF
jgi:hypothetical protein